MKHAPTQDAILRYLKVRPLTPMEVSKLLNIAESTAYARLRRLVDLGKASQRPTWNFRTSKRVAQFFLTKQGMEA